MLKNASVAASPKAKTTMARRAAGLGRRKSIATYCAYPVPEMQVEKLLANGGGEGFVSATTAAYIDAEALNFLIERGERDNEALGGFGLGPSSALEHLDYYPAPDLFHNFEKRASRVVR